METSNFKKNCNRTAALDAALAENKIFSAKSLTFKMLSASVSRVALVSLWCVITAASASAESATQPKDFSIVGAQEISSIGLIHQPTGTSPTTMSDQPTRSEMAWNTALQPGTILVKTAERKLYFIEPNNRAIIWRVAVGREGFAWKGLNTISRKAEWPDWTPPPEMVQREASNGHIIPEFMKGGPGNPLGSRALYLGDSAYRIHGTDKPWTIGQASSSGCIRMMNADVEELYLLAKVGTRVIVE